MGPDKIFIDTIKKHVLEDIDRAHEKFKYDEHEQTNGTVFYTQQEAFMLKDGVLMLSKSA